MANKLPSIGTKAVHKNDHAKQSGPVWQVTGVYPETPKPIRIDLVPRHQLNKGLEPDTKRLTGEEFESDYVQL